MLKGRSREDSAYLLQNLYEDKVLCIYKEGPDVLEHAGRRTVILRARGQPFPLFQGSGSLALLAFLPHHRIRQTYLRSAQAIAAAGLGEDWAAFRRALAAIRKAGYAISHEQIAPGLGGVAVPILLPDDGALVGSGLELSDRAHGARRGDPLGARAGAGGGRDRARVRGAGRASRLRRNQARARSAFLSTLLALVQGSASGISITAGTL